MKRLKLYSSALIAAVAFLSAASLPAFAGSEAGGFVYGGGSSESGGFYMSGAESNTQGILWGVGGRDSESGGVNMSGAESISGGVTRSASSTESGGATMSGSESMASVGADEENLGHYVHYYGNWKHIGDN